MLCSLKLPNKWRKCTCYSFRLYWMAPFVPTDFYNWSKILEHMTDRCFLLPWCVQLDSLFKQYIWLWLWCLHLLLKRINQKKKCHGEKQTILKLWKEEEITSTRQSQRNHWPTNNQTLKRSVKKNSSSLRNILRPMKKKPKTTVSDNTNKWWIVKASQIIIIFFFNGELQTTLQQWYLESQAGICKEIQRWAVKVL